MADELDLSSEREEIARAAAIRRTAQDIPAGVPGNCDECDEWCPRLVRGACPTCRVKYRGEK